MNWDAIEQLLNITDKARQWPTLRAIHDTALGELDHISKHGVTKSTTLLQQLNEASKKHSAEVAAHAETKKTLEKVGVERDELVDKVRELEAQPEEKVEPETEKEPEDAA